jgi:hypothetical protein
LADRFRWLNTFRPPRDGIKFFEKPRLFRNGWSPWNRNLQLVLSHASAYLSRDKALDFKLFQFLISLIERLIVEIEGGLFCEPLLAQFPVGLHGLLKREGLPIL